MKTITILFMLVINLSLFGQNLGKEEAIKWALEHNIPITLSGVNGSYAELMGFCNGIPQYYTTHNYIAYDSSKVVTDKDKINIWADKNGVFSDTLFADGSRLFIVRIENGKPIYSISKNKK